MRPDDGGSIPRWELQAAVHKTFSGRTAKELSVKILESEEGEGTVTMLVHANYLGREFQRAEACLVSGDNTSRLSHGNRFFSSEVPCHR